MWARIKQWRWALLIVALLLGGLIYAFWPSKTSVDTAQIGRGPMSVGITDKAVTRARDVFVVSAPVSGYLARIGLKVGDPVRRGVLITTIAGRPASPLDQRNAAQLRGELASAQARANGAQATLTQARSDLARARALSGRGFLPRAQLEAARTRVATAQADVLQSGAEAARVRAMMTQPIGPGSGRAVPVFAPAGGAVLTVLNDSAGVVAEGTPLMTIGDPRAIEIVVDLLSRQAVKVSLGDRVEVREWGGPEPLVGRVTRIEPYGRLKVSALGIEEQRVNVIARFEGATAAQAARLGHGYQVEATVVLWSAANVLRVPISALYRGNDGSWRVFVNSGERARERALTIGHINDEYAEVQRGLRVGDQVILNPSKALREGSRIQPR